MFTLSSCIDSLEAAFEVTNNEQKYSVQMKNKSTDKALELINSRVLNIWQEVREILTIHYGDLTPLKLCIKNK